jgi:hypothetical protein
VKSNFHLPWTQKLIFPKNSWLLLISTNTSTKNLACFNWEFLLRCHYLCWLGKCSTLTYQKTYTKVSIYTNCFPNWNQHKYATCDDKHVKKPKWVSQSKNYNNQKINYWSKRLWSKKLQQRKIKTWFQPYMEKCSWTKNECVPKNDEMGSFDQIYISY